MGWKVKEHAGEDCRGREPGEEWHPSFLSNSSAWSSVTWWHLTARGLGNAVLGRTAHFPATDPTQWLEEHKFSEDS